MNTLSYHVRQLPMLLHSSQLEPFGAEFSRYPHIYVGKLWLLEFPPSTEMEIVYYLYLKLCLSICVRVCNILITCL